MKNRTDVDGQTAYVVEALDMLSYEKKSLVMDAKVIDDQDMPRLEKCLQDNGVKLASKVQYYIMVENQKTKLLKLNKDGTRSQKTKVS